MSNYENHPRKGLVGHSVPLLSLWGSLFYPASSMGTAEYASGGEYSTGPSVIGQISL